MRNPLGLLRRGSLRSRFAVFAGIVALIVIATAWSGGAANMSSGGSSGASGVTQRDGDSSGSGFSGGSSGSAGAAAGPSAGAPDSANGNSSGEAGSAGGAVRGTSIGKDVAVAAGRAVIRNAGITLRVRDVPAATRQVEQITQAAGGYIANEQGSGITSPFGSNGGAGAGAAGSGSGSTAAHRSGTSSPGGQADLTLQVPTDRFETVISQVGALGTRLSLRRSEQDVTGQVADLDSRLATMKASVERVRALLSKATTVGEIVNVEGELTQRESDLESLEAQRKAMATQVDYATISVSLYSPDVAPPVQTTVTRTGFLGGLQRGWQAFVATTVVLLTAVGALLPFAIVLVPLALLGRWWWRRQTTRTTHAAAPTGTP